MKDMMRSASARRAITSAGLLTLVAVAACGGTEAADAREQAAADAPISVGPENVAVVERATLAVGPLISGSLTAEREATIRAEVGGPVLAVLVEEGQRVSAGSVLARIDDTALRAQMLSARSAVASATSSSATAERELQRATTLVQAGAIADRDLEAARNGLDAASAQLAGARAQLAAAEQQLGNTRVTAPFTGVVSARPVNAGDVVSPGTALVTIIAPGEMRLDASVPAERLSEVRIGAPVTFAVNGYPSRTFTGRVTRINPAADPVTRQVRIQVAIPNAGGALVSGLFAEGRVASEERDVMVAPLAAIDQRGVTPVVYRVKGGLVERVEVQLGMRDEQTERVELIAGVTAGDILLVGAAQGISAGSAVRIGPSGDAAQTRTTPATPAAPAAPTPPAPGSDTTR